MMKTRLPIKKLSTALLLGATAFGVVIPIQATFAQSSTESKMELMTAALRARSQGNLPEAKRNLEELIRIAPNDAEVQKLLAEVNEDISRQASGQAPVLAGSPTTSTSAAGSSIDVSSVDALVAAEVSDAENAVAQAKATIAEAKTLAKAEAYREARAQVEAALTDFPVNRETRSVKEDLEDLRAELILDQALFANANGDFKGARAYLSEYEASYGSDRASRKVENAIGNAEFSPASVDINAVSPDYVESNQRIRQEITKGKAQFRAGDYEGARQTFGRVEAESPNNAETKYFLSEIAKVLAKQAEWDQEKTRSEMIESVHRQWQLPRRYDYEVRAVEQDDETLLDRMREIRLPRVNFNGLPLSRVIDTLSSLSEQYDPSKQGVNIVVIDPTGTDPNVNLRLSDLSLDRVLDFVVQSINYQYDIEDDAIVVRPGTGAGGSAAGLETEFFGFPRGVRIRLLGADNDVGGGSVSNNPFDVAPAAPAGGRSRSDEEDRLKAFFEGAGIPFQSVPGANLVIADAQLIVTNSRRNVEKVQNILRRYGEFRQVEIESKFLEVAQGDLDELGFDWNIYSETTSAAGVTTLDERFRTQNRTLSGAFTIDQGNSSISIRDTAGNADLVPFGAPQIPSTLQLGAGAGPIFEAQGVLGGTTVEAAIRALSQKTGSDLLVAPRVTVLSGKTAEIVVAQELLYPERYTEIQSTASTSSSSGIGGGGSSSISITAGTPEDFIMRNVGVEMSVTPTVEDDRSISLLLEPIVTEFDGFVEYGGPSVAISGDTTVTVPAGFFQPIFSVRRVRTEVTIWDGATVVMGGLTRDEVKTINDKVPVLGDLPLFGRLFRSEGETSQKRNLMIFVTANLISPGGSPANQAFQGVDPGALFQNPQIVTPGGAVSRRTTAQETE